METNQLLINYAAEYETAKFLEGNKDEGGQCDPSWFMHQVKGELNQETIGLIAAVLSYGKRDLFVPKIMSIFKNSGNDIYSWVKEGKFTSFINDDDKCFYRLNTNHHIFQLLSRLQELYNEHESLHKFVCTDNNDAFVAIERIVDYFKSADTGNLIPKHTTSACKRICMYLRWMVRDNSPVDLGLWSKEMDKRTLIIPMDTHVIQQAIQLGLLNNKTASMSVAKKLTNRLKDVFPDDPTKGDFALFGQDVNEKKEKEKQK